MSRAPDLSPRAKAQLAGTLRLRLAERLGAMVADQCKTDDDARRAGFRLADAALEVCDQFSAEHVLEARQ